MDFQVNEELEKLRNGNACWIPAKCPFCFHVIPAFSAAFRSESVYTQQDLEELSEMEQEKADPYIERQDELLEQYWKNFPGSKPMGKNETHAAMHAMNTEHNVIKNSNFELDEDGFPYAMVDEFGRKTTRRLCPHCHNQLPHAYGKFPVRFIAVVGITSSGKTVFLSQLMDYIEEYLTRVNLVPIGIHEELSEYVASHPIRRNKELPVGNPAHLMTLPLPINVENRDTGERYTFIFYDIAGENCVKPDQMQKYGPFIENADGIIMIIDPLQFSDTFDLDAMIDDERDMARPEKVANAMYTAFIDAHSSVSGKSPVPVAIAISKSDMLRPYFENRYTQAHIMFPINYSQYPPNMRGMAFDDCRNVNEEMRRLLIGNGGNLQGETFMNSIDSCFTNSAYFAFSSLGVMPTSKEDENGNKIFFMDESPERTRLEEPFYWLLFRLGIIGAVAKDGRRGYMDPPALIQNGGRANIMPVQKPMFFAQQAIPNNTIKDKKVKEPRISRKRR